MVCTTWKLLLFVFATNCIYQSICRLIAHYSNFCVNGKQTFLCLNGRMHNRLIDIIWKMKYMLVNLKWFILGQHIHVVFEVNAELTKTKYIFANQTLNKDFVQWFVPLAKLSSVTSKKGNALKSSDSKKPRKLSSVVFGVPIFLRNSILASTEYFERQSSREKYTFRSFDTNLYQTQKLTNLSEIVTL